LSSPKTIDDVIANSFNLITKALSDPERNELLECGKRASDHINGLIAFMDWDELRRKWIAFKLADGSPDTTLYDTKQAAIKHQADEFLCAYLLVNGIGPGGTSPRQMAIYIKFNRDLYRRGFRMPDPDSVGGGPTAAMTTGWHDVYKHELPPLPEPGHPLYDEYMEQMRAITEILRKS
jgi:hypothetical protein